MADVPSKGWERIWFGLAALAGLSAVHEFASHGWTYEALALLGGASFCALMGANLRYQRQLTAFKKRFPGWREEDVGKRKR